MIKFFSIINHMGIVGYGRLTFEHINHALVFFLSLIFFFFFLLGLGWVMVPGGGGGGEFVLC